MPLAFASSQIAVGGDCSRRSLLLSPFTRVVQSTKRLDQGIPHGIVVDSRDHLPVSQPFLSSPGRDRNVATERNVPFGPASESYDACFSVWWCPVVERQPNLGAIARLRTSATSHQHGATLCAALGQAFWARNKREGPSGNVNVQDVFSCDSVTP